MFKHFTCGCNHLGWIIHEFRGFEYLLMAIENVDLFVTADREFKWDGCCVLVIFRRDVYSMFFFLHEWYLVILVFGIIKLNYSFIIFGVINLFFAGFFWLLSSSEVVFFSLFCEKLTCLCSCLPSRWWRYPSLLDWWLDRSSYKLSCYEIYLLTYVVVVLTTVGILNCF